MFNQLAQLLGTNGLLPHGYCINWSPRLLSAYVITDGLIALSYYVISVALIYFSRNRQYPVLSKLLWLFAAFIFSCGTTHLIAVLNLWRPFYLLDVTVLVITAVLSVVAAIYLMPVIPKLQRLQYKAKQFEAIVQSSDDAIISKTLDGMVTSWNPRAAAMFGYSAEEMTGKPMLALFPADRQDEEKFILERIQKGEQVSHFETVRLCKNGAEIDVSVTISPIWDSSGNIIGASTIARDITEQKKSSELIWHQANFDQLTDLPNRSLFFDRLAKELSQAKRTQKHVALLFLDIDRFKPVNDNYGHEAGDVVLKTVAQRWQACVREVDTIARLGGDEFAVIVGELDSPEGVSLVAEKLIQSLVPKILLPDGQECSVGTSVGISIYPTNATSSDVLLSTADVAMYKSKARGRNTYTFSDAQVVALTGA